MGMPIHANMYQKRDIMLIFRFITDPWDPWEQTGYSGGWALKRQELHTEGEHIQAV